LLGVHPKGWRNKIVLCDTTAELDMKTLVWTRGESMPLDVLKERMRCPKCGGRNVTVWFEVLRARPSPLAPWLPPMAERRGRCSMAFKPNYGLQRADRNRAVQARSEEKQKRKDEITAQRKAERSAETESLSVDGKTWRHNA
jgi:hypothetical protein